MIPASYYFEWDHFTTPTGRTKAGRKYLIQPADASITYTSAAYTALRTISRSLLSLPGNRIKSLSSYTTACRSSSPTKRQTNGSTRIPTQRI
ncbi:MAG: hypothetical protein IJR19_05170 [Lachnospiraceae bacterium]|nr:hypothetical protein [Lachnospiraceae bacterium]